MYGFIFKATKPCWRECDRSPNGGRFFSLSTSSPTATLAAADLLSYISLRTISSKASTYASGRRSETSFIKTTRVCNFIKVIFLRHKINFVMQMIEVTFLGTVSGVPTTKRNHSAIVLDYYSDERSTLLFDCGEGTQKQLMLSGISFMQIDKIFITHWHADHFAGLIPLIQTMNLEKRTKELKIFAPEAEKFVASIMDLGYFGCRFPVTPINVPFEGEEITKVDEAGEYEILSIPVYHTVPSVAYCFKEKDRWTIDLEKLKAAGLKRGYWLKMLKRDGVATYRPKGARGKEGKEKEAEEAKEIRIEDVAGKKPGLKFVYSGDTRPCDNMVKLARDSDLLIHDSTFLEEDEGKAHADVRQAAEIAKEAKVKQLVLTHLSRRYAAKEDIEEMESTAKKIFPNTKVAYDFMKVVLKN